MRSLPNPVLLALSVILISSASAGAQTRRLTMSGIITDKLSHKPIEAARVNIVGNEANQESTDSEGSFILRFPESVHEGEAVRIHVEKAGYKVYDAWKPVSPPLPLNIFLEPIIQHPKTKPAPQAKENLTSRTTKPTSNSSETHGTIDIVEAKPQRQGTTEEITTKTEGPRTTGPRLGIGPEAYKDLSDVQVGQWAIEEADKIEDMANTAMRPEFVSPEAATWVFKNKFNDCCAQDVFELRTEILRRLGPPGKDPDEISAWTMLFPQLKYPTAPEVIAPGTVRYYAPYLHRLGLRLKRRAAPRTEPLALKFSEQELPPEKPGYSHILVTIETTKELTSGYVAVEFSGQPYSAGCDFENSKLPFTSGVQPENPVVVDLLKATTNYVLQIGKTPFRPSNPIHVEARGSSAVHISGVLYLDE